MTEQVETSQVSPDCDDVTFHLYRCLFYYIIVIEHSDRTGSEQTEYVENKQLFSWHIFFII